MRVLSVSITSHVAPAAELPSSLMQLQSLSTTSLEASTQTTVDPDTAERVIKVVMS